MSVSLWSQGLQHTRLPCLSLSPEVCSNSCPLTQWCHPTISSSVVPFSCLQSFPESGSFPKNWLFTSGGQDTGASALASVLSMNIQGLFPLGLTGLIFLLSKGLSKVFSSTTVWKHQFIFIFMTSFKTFETYLLIHKWKWNCSVVSDLCNSIDCSPWNSLGQNTGVDSFTLLQGIFPTQGLNPGLLHCRWILYQLSHKGSASSIK